MRARPLPGAGARLRRRVRPAGAAPAAGRLTPLARTAALPRTVSCDDRSRARRRRPARPTLPEPGSDPEWFKRAVFYEVLVRGFADSNGDGTGDLRGLIDKLDYLQWLGVDCLWLPPFYPSPLRDGGYDVSDYTARAAGVRHHRGLQATSSTRRTSAASG